MAKENEQQQTTELPGEVAEPSRKRGRMIALGAVLGVMIVEAVVIFALVKTFVAPQPQAALAGPNGALDPNAGQKAPEPVEVEIVKLRAQNDRSQRILVYDMTVFVVVQSDKEEEFKELLAKRSATIRDRFTRIVRASDPARFAEPDLATLRAQFKHEMEQVLGTSDLVQEVLIPSFTQYGEG